jgi:hypothetical protein
MIYPPARILRDAIVGVAKSTGDHLIQLGSDAKLYLLAEAYKEHGEWVATLGLSFFFTGVRTRARPGGSFEIQNEWNKYTEASYSTASRDRWR